MCLMENNDETGSVSSEPQAARSRSQSHHLLHLVQPLRQRPWQRQS